MRTAFRLMTDFQGRLPNLVHSRRHGQTGLNEGSNWKMLYGLIRPFHSKERNYRRQGVRGSNRLIPTASGIGHSRKGAKNTLFTRKK